MLNKLNGMLRVGGTTRAFSIQYRLAPHRHDRRSHPLPWVKRSISVPFIEFTVRHSLILLHRNTALPAMTASVLRSRMVSECRPQQLRQSDRLPRSRSYRRLYSLNFPPYAYHLHSAERTYYRAVVSAQYPTIGCDYHHN